MLDLFRSKTFIKEYRKIKFGDKQYTRYIVFVTTLLQENRLPEEAHDHALIGNYLGYREFHVSGDLLVIYVVKDGKLHLARIGSHSELYRK